MIILFDSFNNGYNLTTGGDRHYIVSDATKIKLSESHKGIKPSEYCKQKTSERFKGIPKSEETKEKMSKSKKGKPKKHKNWNFGKRGYKIKPASEERKRKIGDAQMGSKNHNYGKKTPESVKQKCRDSYHGEQCHLAKITDEIAREIKIALNNGITGVSLSKLYNVSTHIISRIKSGKTWKHIIV
mgnify:FL=1